MKAGEFATVRQAAIAAGIIAEGRSPGSRRSWLPAHESLRSTSMPTPVREAHDNRPRADAGCRRPSEVSCASPAGALSPRDHLFSVFPWSAWERATAAWEASRHAHAAWRRTPQPPADGVVSRTRRAKIACGMPRHRTFVKFYHAMCEWVVKTEYHPHHQMERTNPQSDLHPPVGASSAVGKLGGFGPPGVRTERPHRLARRSRVA